ncbi:MAG: quinol dehydrogenase ferredoxin subunit NapH [Gammaproteobacteria bacterium]|nr:MAG: quinol dehydrogenase ferredoxin subunit NapH [Gammaproteobacteria bacterium]
MAATSGRVGAEAIRRKGWLRANKWLLLRRTSQLGLLALFLAGPWFGAWIVKGTLASSLTLDLLPLSDPYILLQGLLAGHLPHVTALIGAGIVLAFYLLVGGRVYCSWVCPVNLVTDAAAWLRRRLGLRGAGSSFSRTFRYWLLGTTLVLAALAGTIVWELVNPVTILHRGLLFGMGTGWLLILGIFLFDLLITRHGWCGHLCPVGAFYSLLAVVTPVRVSATDRSRCNDCMDCFQVCPEPQVITPALKGEAKGIGPMIRDINCTNCGRCVDVCSEQVFGFTLGRDNPTPTIHQKMETSS